MPGPAPKLERRRRNVPARGEWQAAAGYGWQHGETPKPPSGLSAAARKKWGEWMAGWPASFWHPDDLSGLEVAIRLYDRQLVNPSTSQANVLGQWMDRYGLTPKGLQERHWLRPKKEAPVQPADTSLRRLRVVGE